jgi:hypothetical protein
MPDIGELLARTFELDGIAAVNDYQQPFSQ